MIEHVVFLLEEPSAQDFLQGVLPGLLPTGVTAHFLVFEGKQDLEKQLLKRLKGWLRPNSRFIIMRDQDSGDCRVIKQRLQALCAAAGRPDAVVRIACRELEAFLCATGKPSRKLLRNRLWQVTTARPSTVIQIAWAAPRMSSGGCCPLTKSARVRAR